MVFRPPKTWNNAGVKDTDLNREVRDQIRAMQKQILVLQVSSAAGTVLPGTVVPHTGLTIPTGWLLCDGKSTYSTTTYAALHGIIGYQYGGAGATFAVPDLRSKMPRGNTTIGDGTISSRGNASGGDSTTVTQTLTVSNTVNANAVGDHFHQLSAEHYHSTNSTHNFAATAAGHAHNNGFHGHTIGGSTANGNRGAGNVLRAFSGHVHSTNTESLGATTTNNDSFNVSYAGEIQNAVYSNSAYPNTGSGGGHAHTITHNMVFDHSHTANTLPAYAEFAFVIKT
jgi:microcystin-dependent protein